MPANLENSAVATGLEKVSFHSKFHISRVANKVLFQKQSSAMVNCYGKALSSRKFYGYTAYVNIQISQEVVGLVFPSL